MIYQYTDLPITYEQQQKHEYNELWNKAQCHLLNLRRGLKDANDHAHNQDPEKQRTRDERSNPECLFAECYYVANHHIEKLAVSDCIMSIQPSAKTNSMSLNGIEIIMGESIIMPIDISTLATTRSIITNGM